MKAIKENKVYKVSTDEEAKIYKAKGFDILDDNGKVKEYGSGKTVSLDKFNEIEKENLKLQKEIAKLKKSNEKPEK